MKKTANSWEGKTLVTKSANDAPVHVLEDYGKKVMLRLENGLCIVLSKEATLMTRKFQCEGNSISGR